MIAIPLIIVGLESLCLWIVMFGARKSWLYLTSAIAKLFKKRSFNWRFLVLPTIGIGSVQVNTALRDAQNDLGSAAKEAEPTTAGFLAGLGAALDYHAFTTKYLAAGTLDALDKLRRTTIPDAAGAHAGTARDQSRAASRRAKAAQDRATRAERKAGSAAREAGRARSEAAKARADAAAAAHAGTVTAPWDLPWNRAREQADSVTRWFARWRKWVIAGLGAAAFTGIVSRVLVRHLPWYQCRNVKDLARGVCRMDRGLLDALLAGTTLILSAISLVEFARETQAFEEVADDAMRFFIRELHTLENVDDLNRAAFLALYQPAG
jgi:hypothetical protein